LLGSRAHARIVWVPSLRDSLILFALTQHLRAGLSYAAASRLVLHTIYAMPSRSEFAELT